MAKRLNLDIDGIPGMGSNRRITINELKSTISLKRVPCDVDQDKSSASKKLDEPRKEVSRSIPETSSGEEFLIKPINHIRRITAEKLSASKRDVPHFYLSLDCETDSLLNFKNEMGCQITTGFSLNDLILFATARALKKHPEANASWSDDGIRISRDVNLAVAISTECGLLTPVIRNADQKGVEIIASEMRDYRERALQNKLTIEEFKGGTFSVSNLGMFGIQQAIEMISPPQACILAVGSVERKTLSRENKTVHASIMTLTLTCDHRVVDGVDASRFLSCLKLYLEEPLRMLV